MIRHFCTYCDSEFTIGSKNKNKIFCSDSCRRLEHKYQNNQIANPYIEYDNFGNIISADFEYYNQIINERIQFDMWRSNGNYIVDECLMYLKTGHYKKINKHLDYLTRKLTRNTPLQMGTN